MLLRVLNYPFVNMILVCCLLFPSIVLAQRSAPPTPAVDPPVLAPKLQKELGKALEALRAHKPSDAHSHLDAVYQLAPADTDVNFLFGIYSAEMNDWVRAKTYWERVLVVFPSHVGALLSLGDALLRENRPADAAPYLSRAVEAEPSAWRARAVLADAYLRQGLLDDSIHQAERALELGHGHAEVVQALLARALHLRSEKERAELFGEFSLPANPVAPPEGAAAIFSPLLPSNWLPPDIDETVPPVEPDVACDLEDVLRKSAQRIVEFVANVDKFTATEAVTHESINKWGLHSRPKTFQFEYLVSVQELRAGVLAVDEYRDGNLAPIRFPDGIGTKGLPALVLIFHPYHSPNFEMLCEGQARWNGGLAWQVYFRQRADKPNTIRAYKVGERGPDYPAPLKGRAWIAADSYQVIRLETDLLAPVPEIRLATDHVVIEYGPVHFRSRNLDMWLPQSAEIHYDWRGRRARRLHSFSNYLLFSVDDKQHISVPQADAPASAGSSGVATKSHP